MESGCWNRPEQKLTGLALGHFAGFYRGSWRVNDFMWGRLDAAVRVTDLLVAPGRAKQLREDNPSFSAAEILADDLLECEPAEDQRWLLDEALRALDGEDLPSADTPPPPADASRPAQLVAAIADDLGLALGAARSKARDGNGRPHQDPLRPRRAARDPRRRARAARRKADEQDAHRRRLAALRLPLENGSLRRAIAELRDGDRRFRNGLPPTTRWQARWRCATGTHAALVSLGVLLAAAIAAAAASRSPSAPPCLPIAGSVARRWRNRAPARRLVFDAAAAFLAARASTTPKAGPETLHMIALIAVLVTLFRRHWSSAAPPPRLASARGSRDDPDARSSRVHGHWRSSSPGWRCRGAVDVARRRRQRGPAHQRCERAAPARLGARPDRRVRASAGRSLRSPGSILRPCKPDPRAQLGRDPVSHLLRRDHRRC